MHGRLVVDGVLQVLGAVVGVDQAFDVPAEPECEQQVVLGRRHPSKRAACPWPTPTHIVAIP